MAMWQKLSLRARLNTLLALGSDARPGHQYRTAGAGGWHLVFMAEDQSVIRLARGFVETLGVGHSTRLAIPKPGSNK
jgi:two-component system sensor histidine kinase UhpB